MTRQTVKIIVFVILGITAAVMLFLAAFRYFKPERFTPVPSDEENAAVLNDPASSLYVSEDGGETWRGVANAQFVPYHFLFIPQKKRLLIGTGESGVWEADSGNLQSVERGEFGSILPENSIIYDFAVSRSQPVVYAAARYGSQGYLVSLERPLRELFFAPLEDSPVRSVALDPFAENHLLTGAGTGLFESKDGGATWKAIYWFKQAIRDIAIHPFVPGWYFVSTQKGEVFRTPDEGKTWEDLTRGFSRMRGTRENQRISVDAVSGILYITSDHGLIASEDDGSTWRDIPLIAPPDSLPIIGFAVHPALYETLYVSAGNQIYKSTDGGESWKGLRFPEKGSITAIAVNPENPAMVVIGFAQKSNSRRSIFNFIR